jgi:hypothetical protein
MSGLLRIEAQRDEVASTVLERTALSTRWMRNSFLKTDRQLPKANAMHPATERHHD